MQLTDSYKGKKCREANISNGRATKTLIYTNTADNGEPRQDHPSQLMTQFHDNSYLKQYPSEVENDQQLISHL